MSRNPTVVIFDLDGTLLVQLTPGDPDELDAFFDGCLACYRAAWRAFPDVDPALSALAALRVRTAVLTNGTTEQQNAKLAAVGLSARVGPVFTSGQLGVAKPEPAAYRAVCHRLGLAPDATLHVGDDHELDVPAPRAAGLRAVHLDRSALGPDDNASHDGGPRISSLDPLPALVDGQST
jgi:putative hydrolase of the HAD superfamily